MYIIIIREGGEDGVALSTQKRSDNSLPVHQVTDLEVSVAMWK
jgi:hypothetical protein